MRRFSFIILILIVTLFNSSFVSWAGETINSNVCDSNFKEWVDDTWNWFRYNNLWFYKSGYNHCFWKEKIESIYRFCDEKNKWRTDLWNWFFSDKWVLCFSNNSVIEKESFWKKELKKDVRMSICNKNTSCYWNDFKSISVDKFKFYWEENGWTYIWIWDNVYVGHKLIVDVTSQGFELLNDMYYKDSENVFYNRKIIEWADPISFKALHQWWGVDTNNLYKWSEKLDVIFDYDTITVVKWTPIDKNQAYTINWIISHKEFIEIKKISFDELWLNFQMNTDHFNYLFIALWIFISLWLIFFIIKNTKKNV